MRLNVPTLLDIIPIVGLALVTEVCARGWRSPEEGDTKFIAEEEVVGEERDQQRL